MIHAPQPEPGRGPALALTALMHLLLVAALFFGVQWKRNAPIVVEAELWSARPQPAVEAPPPPPAEPKVEPKPDPKPAPKIEPPPPAKPDIAIKQDKKPPKPEPKKPEPRPDPKPEVKPSPNDALAALQREENSRRIDAERAQLAAAATNRSVATWGDRIRGKIRGNIVSPPGLQGNPTAEFAVMLLVTGEIMDVRLKRGSGNAAWDAAVERAILKSSPLPKPDNPAAFQRDLSLKICPDEDRGCR